MAKAKKEVILKDVQGVQICLGDKVALIEKNWRGAPSYHLKVGKVVKLNSKSFKWVPWAHRNREIKDMTYGTENRLYPELSSLVLDGEFVRDGKIIS